MFYFFDLLLPALEKKSVVWIKFFCLWIALVFSGVVCAQDNFGKGRLDFAQYDAEKKVLLLRGWAAPEMPNVYTSNIIIFWGGEKIYQGGFLRFERQDVVNSLNRFDWLWSGWEVEVNIKELPRDKGDFAIKFVLTDGGVFDIGGVDIIRAIDFKESLGPALKTKIFVGLAIFLPLLFFVFGEELSRCLKWGRPEIVFALVVVFSFLSLVAAGVTGSSVRLAFGDSSVLSQDMVPWQGEARTIRSDEWNILTQMAIGQVNHQEKFPVINKNVGVDGMNMMIIGMTGVPVNHISSMAKPATWGFWLFDLRRALAWHWWFAFYGCFLALWVLFIRFFDLGWRVSALLGLGVAGAPYSLVFSGHPSYLVFFLATSLICLDVILKTSKKSLALGLGGVLGMGMAGFVLVLYLPWQIALIYFALPFGFTYWYGVRERLNFRGVQFFSLMVAVCVFLILVGTWFLDVVDILRVVASTVYPGQRSTSVGGDIDPWFFIKGMTNPVTLYQESPMLSASAAGSFVWIWPALFVAVALTCFDLRKNYALPAVLSTFILVALLYMYVGFPRKFADLTLWGRVTSYRLDLALGLAQFFLLAWLLSVRKNISESLPLSLINFFAKCAAMFCFLFAVWNFSLLPADISRNLTIGFVAVSCLFLAFLAYLTILRKYEWVAGIVILWMVGGAFLFNPIDVAPKKVELNNFMRSAIGFGNFDREIPRVAVLNEDHWRMNLVAAGVPVVNAVLYYPQSTLWKNIDSGGNYKTQYNRYQNLIFVAKNLDGESSLRIDSPRLDAVRVTLDSRRFDFRLLGATHVITSPKIAEDLIFNGTLEKVESSAGWVVLKVLKNAR